MWTNIYNYTVVENDKLDIKSHAQLPTPIIMNNSVRVFFASRDARSYSSIYYVDLTIAGRKVESSFEVQRVLSPGDIGEFDQHGVYPSEIKLINDRYYLYFIGWNKGVESPMFYASVGLAASVDCNTFTKSPDNPLLQRGRYDPCFVTSPSIFNCGEDEFIMFYTSGLEWKEEEGKLQSYYHIKSAYSNDCINWDRNGDVAIPLASNETNVARGSVIRKDGRYYMYFCFVDRGTGFYKLGKAISDDLKIWVREFDTDEFCNLNNGSEMLAYPYVFSYQGSLYMLYNSGRYGSNGFSLAIFEEDYSSCSHY